ncbi:uncharacterized protein LOC115995874 [Ipomoea triloba]|uniref:uncharacterized protein LOC115995874 n=1 Tax=Ipomoea triloba TaxID=35885 RepID=UPI00125E0DD8|nr:uncharacterized protein LOC115995874 [Ipomoea triloba]
MAVIAKREFTELALDGSNYLTWALDVEIYLTSTELQHTIIENFPSDDAQKAKALIFLRHHLNHDLKNEYLTEKDPNALWKSLKDPLHKVVSQLKLCKQDVSDTDLIEKTLSTFHANNLVLQQQYRAKNYSKHSELISALLVAEKHNQLLMRNHNARPAGTAPIPEIHNVAQSDNNRRGRGRGRGRGRCRGPKRGGSSGANKTDSQTLNKQPENQDRRGKQNICYRCGCKGHWSRTCRTPKHLVDAYQKMIHPNDEQKTNESSQATLPEANALLNLNDDLLGEELVDYGNQA